MPAVKISIITVSYNSEDFINKFAESVLKYKPSDSELIVIDNDSTDKTATILEKFIPRLKLIKSSENLGFSKASNLAAKEAKGQYLFFLNPDTEFLSEPLGELVNFYEKVSAGIVGPKLIMPSGKPQASVKKLPTVWGAIKEYILGIKYSYSEYVPEGGEPVEVEQLYGAALLISKDLFWRVGGFNEKFFLYYEDAELCRQIRNLGKKVYYYPESSIKHLVGATKSSQNKYKLNLEAARKYHGFFKALVLQLIFRTHGLLRR